MLWALALLCLSSTSAETCDHQSALQVRNVTSAALPLTEWLPDQQLSDVKLASGDSNASGWRSGRDLAVLPAPFELRFADGETMRIFSAVPSFGEDGNFIALLLTKNTKRWVSDDHPLFCSGANGAHRRKVRGYRRVLLCDWPAEEADRESFDVFLEDLEGNHLLRVLARRKAGLLQKYHTVACVRDVFFESGESFSAALKQLVEWMEFSKLHGIEHFFLYTFRGTEDAVKEVLMSYIREGLATRIHFDDYPSDKIHRQHQVVNDCLYRAKSHTTWVLPSVDVDEYFHFKSGQIFPDGVVPQDYLKTAWDAVVKSNGKRLEEVKSVSFRSFRFARAPSDSLEISSSWREPELPRSHHHPEKLANGKYACNVHVVHGLWFHFPTSSEKGVEDIMLPETLGVGNHYRVDWQSGHKYGDHFGRDDPKATTFDASLTSEVPLLEEAIEQRFGEKPQMLLKRLSAEHPPVHLQQSSGGTSDAAEADDFDDD
eukprot:s546_g11.t1